MTTSEHDDIDMTAAELALGLLDGGERAAALRRVLAEPGFAREVEVWRAHFATLFAQWPEADAPDDFPRIEAALSSPAVVKPRFWQSVAAASTLLAACLVLALLFRPGAAPPTPAAAPAPLVAALAPTDKSAPLAAVYDSAAGEIRVASATLAPNDRAAELWAIAGDGVPHSLGLLTPGGATTVRIAGATRARMAAGTTLAVSVEPLGGSPTGLPTGPVVASGALSRV
ncbi:anti-sigma factor [soil metagenome]